MVNAKKNLKNWVGLILCYLSFAVSAQNVNPKHLADIQEILRSYQHEYKDPKHRALVQELVRITSMPSVFLADEKYIRAGRDQSTPELTKQAECVIKTMDRKLVEKLIVENYLPDFSASQVAEAIQFYKTPTGKKWVQHWAAIASGKIPNDGNSPRGFAPNFSYMPHGLTDSDIANMKEFAKTEAGKRFLEKASTPIALTAEILHPMVSDLYTKCEDPKHRTLVQELVRIISMPGVFLADEKYILAGKKQATPESTKRAECVVKAMDRKLVEKEMVEIYMHWFPGSHIAQAIQFYKTPTGKKWVQHWADIANGKIVHDDAPLPRTFVPDASSFPLEMNGSDIANIKEFAKTEAGQQFSKIGKQAMKVVSDSSKLMINDDLYKKCSR
jgi:hypothetical protein